MACVAQGASNKAKTFVNKKRLTQCHVAKGRSKKEFKAIRERCVQENEKWACDLLASLLKTAKSGADCDPDMFAMH